MFNLEVHFYAQWYLDICSTAADFHQTTCVYIMASVLLQNASVWQWAPAMTGTRDISGNAEPNSFIAVHGGVIIDIGDMSKVPSANDFDLVVDVNHQLVLPGLSGVTSCY